MESDFEALVKEGSRFYYHLDGCSKNANGWVWLCEQYRYEDGLYFHFHLDSGTWKSHRDQFGVLLRGDDYKKLLETIGKQSKKTIWQKLLWWERRW